MWSEVAETKARQSLVKAISELRARVPDYVTIQRQSISFNPNGGCRIDVADFRTMLDAVNSAEPSPQLTQLTQLYRGDFLAGFQVRVAPAI